MRADSVKRVAEVERELRTLNGGMRANGDVVDQRARISGSFGRNRARPASTASAALRASATVFAELWLLPCLACGESKRRGFGRLCRRPWTSAGVVG